MRKEYLRNHKVARFNILTLQNRLDSHLMEIDSQARQRVDHLMIELLEKDPAPDKMADTICLLYTSDEWTSTEESHVIKELVVGKEYTMTETKPADGYVTAESITCLLYTSRCV